MQHELTPQMRQTLATKRAYVPTVEDVKEHVAIYFKQYGLDTETTYTCDGKLETDALLIYSTLEVSNMNFSGYDDTLEFNGTAWGLGLGAMTAEGTGFFSMSPQDLLNAGSFDWQMTFLDVGGGGALVIFFDGQTGAPVGAFAAVGGGIGGGDVVGSGSFKVQ